MTLSLQKNLYKILEIPTDADISEIKTAYRKLARKYHPDLNNGDEFCTKKFKEITEAYEILSNPEKKKNYDLLKGINSKLFKSEYGKADKAYRASNDPIKEQKNKKQNDSFSNVLNDILNGFKKTTSSTKTSSFKENDFKTKQFTPERGSDIYTDVAISILEANEGTTRIVNILHTQTCPNCQGRPFLNGAKCHVCNGLGEQSSHKKLTVKIPAGVKNRAKIRIANEGNKGYNGGKNGDLYLNIKIENDSNFKLDGLNILYEVSISPSEAVLGATIEICPISEKISMKITPNTHSGQKFRLAGQGLVQDNQKGDIIVTVNIDIPNNLSKEEIDLYKKLKDIKNKETRENK